MIEILANNVGLIIGTLSSLGLLYTLFNEKVREFLNRKKNLRKSQAELKQEITIADDNIIDTYINRINKMGIDFDELMDKMSEAQKENLETRTKNIELQYQLETFKAKVKRSCQHNCLEI